MWRLFISKIKIIPYLHQHIILFLITHLRYTFAWSCIVLYCTVLCYKNHSGCFIQFQTCWRFMFVEFHMFLPCPCGFPSFTHSFIPRSIICIANLLTCMFLYSGRKPEILIQVQKHAGSRIGYAEVAPRCEWKCKFVCALQCWLMDWIRMPCI